MPLFVQTNFAALAAQKNLNINQGQLNGSFQKLSSGYRINSAADDAAGLAISEAMKSDIRSYSVAERNAMDGISMAQTAEGALGEIHQIVARMRELAVQSSNGSMSSQDRGFLQTEFGELQAEIVRIQGAAQFNGQALLNTAATTIDFQVGIGTTASDQVSVTFGAVDLTAITAGISVTGVDETNSWAAINALDTSMDDISTARARFGAVMNRLEVSAATVATMRVNTSAANSRIRDVDVAAETAFLSRNQVLTQTGIAVLAQANQLPQSVLQLLR
ncbi:MAG: flagellin [Polyangiaceae bacterium]|nr:flagellin [Polyangiaceae bacterium]